MKEDIKKAVEEFIQAEKELHDTVGKPEPLTRERAIAFISHITGHGASVIDEVMEERSKKGSFSCVIGQQVYNVRISFRGVIILFHSFVGDHVKIKYFHADSFKVHNELNEEHLEATKEEIRYER